MRTSLSVAVLLVVVFVADAFQIKRSGGPDGGPCVDYQQANDMGYVMAHLLEKDPVLSEFFSQYVDEYEDEVLYWVGAETSSCLTKDCSEVESCFDQRGQELCEFFELPESDCHQLLIVLDAVGGFIEGLHKAGCREDKLDECRQQAQVNQASCNTCPTEFSELGWCEGYTNGCMSITQTFTKLIDSADEEKKWTFERRSLLKRKLEKNAKKDTFSGLRNLLKLGLKKRK